MSDLCCANAGVVQSVTSAPQPTKTPVSALSQELLDEIVDYLSDDTQSLRSVASVCRALVLRAQRHLLRRIRVRVEDESLERVTRDFGASTASAYVKELVFDFWNCHELAFETTESVAPVAPLFGSVKVIELRDVIRLRYEHQLVEDIHYAYSLLVDLSRVNSLVIDGLHTWYLPDLQGILRPLTKVRTLWIESETIDCLRLHPDSFIPQDPPLLPCLENLNVRVASAPESVMITWLDDNLRPGGLTKLRLVLNNSNVEEAIPRNCAANLVSLEVNLNGAVCSYSDGDPRTSAHRLSWLSSGI